MKQNNNVFIKLIFTMQIGLIKILHTFIYPILIYLPHNLVKSVQCGFSLSTLYVQYLTINNYNKLMIHE